MGYSIIKVIITFTLLSFTYGQPASNSNDADNSLNVNLRTVYDRPGVLDVPGDMVSGDYGSFSYFSSGLGDYSYMYSGPGGPQRPSFPYPEYESFSSICPLHSVLRNFQKVPGTIRDASSSPLISRGAFDPVLVGWTGHYSQGLVAQGVYPDMSLFVSRDGGNSFTTPLAMFRPTKGRLITTSKYRSTIIVGGQEFPGGTLVAYYSNDDGRTFQKSYSGATGIFYGSCLTDANEGFLVGILGQSETLATEPTPFQPLYERAVLLQTLDGGKTWTNIFIGGAGTKVNFRGVSCPRRGNLVVVGSSDGRQAVWTSSDSGRTFSNPFLFGTNVLFDVSLSSTGFGLAVGGTTKREDRSSTSAVIVRSRDSGRTWREVFRGSGVLYGVQVFSRRFALAVGVSAQARALLYRSVDAGNSWQRYRPSIGWDVLYSITSGNFMRTIDYHNVTTYTDPRLIDLHNHFSEPDTLLVGGNYGTSGDGRSPRLVEMCEYGSSDMIYGPGPNYPGPNPNYPGPNPNYPGPNPNYPGPNPNYPGPNPNYPGPNPNYPGPNPNYPGPNPNYPNMPGFPRGNGRRLVSEPDDNDDDNNDSEDYDDPEDEEDSGNGDL